ncbi:response regulator transcription factor [Streptomyces specialis]|uniref:response regulator transcription factor n=1 Tax=Streptomyces specialis TaxID=498367 RepID=UPI000A5F6622|nr:response regulator transcription factor [Streptomyces specialis]
MGAWLSTTRPRSSSAADEPADDAAGDQIVPAQTRIPLGSNPVVLLADADERIRQGLSAQLAKYQVSVVHCADGATALLEAGLRKPDVLLVSADLPVIDGATVLRLVRRRLSIPVVLGVGPDDTAQVAPALAAGASACVARPYRPREVAQLLSLADRGARGWDQPLVCGPLTLDPSSYEVRMHGMSTARLPLREFQLLHLLMLHAEKVITRDRIRAELWGEGARRSNTITVHIRRLRERLGDDPHHPEIIQTVRGVGYRLVPPSS